MTQLSIQSAADRAGVTRQTIYKKINDGELSATIDNRGNKQIDVSELLRVYPNLSSSDVQAKATVHKLRHVKTSSDTGVLQLELERAKMQLELRDRELQLAQERIAELKSREAESKSRERDAQEEKQRLLGVIESQTRLLAAPAPAAAAKPAARAKPKAVTEPKPSAKAHVAKAPAKPTAARKTPVALAKTLAKPAARSKPAPTMSKTAVAKKATRK